MGARLAARCAHKENQDWTQKIGRVGAGQAAAGGLVLEQCWFDDTFLRQCRYTCIKQDREVSLRNKGTVLLLVVIGRAGGIGRGMPPWRQPTVSSGIIKGAAQLWRRAPARRLGRSAWKLRALAGWGRLLGCGLLPWACRWLQLLG